MKQENNVKYIFRLTLTLLLITALVAAALAGVNVITKDKIAAIQREKTQKAMEEVLPGYGEYQTHDFTDGTGTVKAVYVPYSHDGGTIRGIPGYVVEVEPAGFGGKITMMVGIEDGAVSGVSIVSHAETAGLGSVAADKTEKGVNFRSQFVGADAEVKVNKDGGTIDAITSATITSRAVTEGVNAALAVQVKG